MSEQQTTPWPRQKLDLHVTQRIREWVDIALVLYHTENHDIGAKLRDGGEETLWQVVLLAIDDAGWLLLAKDKQ